MAKISMTVPARYTSAEVQARKSAVSEMPETTDLVLTDKNKKTNSPMASTTLRTICPEWTPLRQLFQ